MKKILKGSGNIDVGSKMMMKIKFLCVSYLYYYAFKLMQY